MTKQSVHIMVDLETLDTKSTAHVLSAAVVPFDPFSGTPIMLTCTKYVWLSHCVMKQNEMCFGTHDQGGTVSINTLGWWSKQNTKYFTSLLSAYADKNDFKTFIKQFNAEIQNLREEPDIELNIWCTGTFDLDILRNASERFGVEFAVPYYAQKDVRVCRVIAEQNGLIDDMPATHNAYEDCLRQIKYVSAVYGNIKDGRATE